ncbi:unnamed protein product [Closterium sp. NIES-53]
MYALTSVALPRARPALPRVALPRARPALPRVALPRARPTLPRVALPRAHSALLWPRAALLWPRAALLWPRAALSRRAPVSSRRAPLSSRRAPPRAALLRSRAARRPALAAPHPDLATHRPALASRRPALVALRPPLAARSPALAARHPALAARSPALARCSCSSVRVRPLCHSSIVCGLLSVGCLSIVVVVAVAVQLVSWEFLEVARCSCSGVHVRPLRPSSLLSQVLVSPLSQAPHLVWPCTFTLDSGASRCFFRDSTTVTLLSAPVAVSLADPSGGPVLARSSMVLPCPAVPSGSLSPFTAASSLSLSSTCPLSSVKSAALPLSCTSLLLSSLSLANSPFTAANSAASSLSLSFTCPFISLISITRPLSASSSLPLAAANSLRVSSACTLISLISITRLHSASSNSLLVSSSCTPSALILISTASLNSAMASLLAAALSVGAPPAPRPSPSPPARRSCMPPPWLRKRPAGSPSFFRNLVPPNAAPPSGVTMPVHVWVYPLKTKGEVAAAVLKEWMPRAKRESGHKVKVARTDNGGEFIGNKFEAVLKKKKIRHQLTVPYNPQQDGVAERFNWTLQEVVGAASSPPAVALAVAAAAAVAGGFPFQGMIGSCHRSLMQLLLSSRFHSSNFPSFAR